MERLRRSGLVPKPTPVTVGLSRLGASFTPHLLLLILPSSSNKKESQVRLSFLFSSELRPQNPGINE